ncbi:MAG: lysoplasmalogenase [Sandaracinus sp.]|nr:lysoplasmalogenase [Sandaracinus sp.]MCB9621561.1 lysoplasmalogenase [Sandaracinus sp.]MCB9635109.1 lysoplasmalogenase [Sandaracinus sp.]
MGRVWAGLAVVAAFVFAVAVVLDLHALRLAVKLLPVIAMIAHARGVAAPTKETRFVIAGLVASLFGDAFLEIDPAGLFVAGLVSFLIAHVLYVIGFTSDVRALAPVRALPAYAYGVGVLGLLVADLGRMTIPVGVYTFVICTMLWRAGARVGTSSRATVAMFGAASFAISDTLIAFSRFGGAYFDEELRRGAPWRLAIMALYWLGQWGIARSLPPASAGDRG